MQDDFQSGTPVMYNDETVGTVERVERDARTGEVQAFVLRSGRSPALLRIDANLVQADPTGALRIAPGLQLDALEQEAIGSGRLPPEGGHLGDAGPTEPAPIPERVLGPESGMPESYDGPATG